MEYVKLIGILIIVVGFVFKLDTLAVVVIAGLATALVSGLSITEFLEIMGGSFVEQRYVTFFVLMLPMVGLAERYGMRYSAVNLIQRFKKLTAGKFVTLYLTLRQIAGIMSIRIGGHIQLIRPIVEPMAQAAITTKYGKNDDFAKDLVKGQVSAAENFGNFFSQQAFVGASGVLLIVGALKELGYPVTNVDIALASLPVVLFTWILGWVWNWHFDRKLDNHFADSQKEAK